MNKTIYYKELLESDYNRWDKLYIEGGYDPFWSDGCNLNLVRNHIMNTRREIEENMKEEDFPEIYYKEVPPEVDSEYMAKTDEIKTNAEKTLNELENDENYKYIVEHASEFSPITKKRMYISQAIGRMAYFKKAIQDSDLVTLRRMVRRRKDELDFYKEIVNKMKMGINENMQLELSFEEL